MHLVGSDASRLEGTIHSPWNFICCRRPGINPEANEQGGGMSMPSLKDRDPSGQLQLVQFVLKEAAGNRPTANQHVDDAFVPAPH
ncbi:hypothetical protein ALC56_11396 [Trachymyrmex septentrionalis]|uniref:Uncharacterized protein n=1 Tax=Trachymyrmex septentrionalis TaxID=34720 RepID=A0A195F2H4_9HYME|nr:hypothetical protein ALC56_11396 [Trachymyrmex septentrionalis]